MCLAVFLPVGIYHRLKSQATRERLDRRQEGVFMLVSLRLCGLLAWIGLFAWLMNAAWISRFSMPLPIWLRWVGAGTLPVSVLLVSWVFRSLGKNLTDTVVTRAEHTLVTTGPYRWVRPPVLCRRVLILCGCQSDECQLVSGRGGRAGLCADCDPNPNGGSQTD